MELALEAADNAAMDEQIYVDMALRDEATDLAHQRFKNPSEGHIDCVYLRLVKNQEWGLGYAGAVTVH